MRAHAKFLNGIKLFLPVQSRREKYSGLRRAQISSQQRRLVPMRGGSRSSRTRDETRWTLRVLKTNGT
jgi:hypothetical protein